MDIRYAWIDDGGDTGLKFRSLPSPDEPGSSRTLVLASVVERPSADLKRVLTEVKKEFRINPRQEVKFSGGQRRHSIRMKLLNKLSFENIDIFYSVLYKTEMDGQMLLNDQRYMYNYPMKFLFEHLDNYAQREGFIIQLVVDARRQHLNTSLQNYLSLLQGRGQLRNIVPHIIFGDSAKLASLQAADFITGAIYYAYEFYNPIYWDIISHLVRGYRTYPPHWSLTAPRKI